ncbi:YCII-related domain-containing protein [Mumia flava]|uniref:YCII-related domain-containing protein n=1 Tax=Mumia flava TaxID=1348852 RepID=A0A0B2BNN5_9ACTN|nr:YciI family protein [Mumia flava]PJJ57941.1 YCII-related domain-containing protein [Mumia flava]
MTRDPNVPDAFDVYTVVVLRRPQDAPALSDAELDELQTRHLAYRAGLARDGVVVANGPFDAQSDPALRGLSIFACGPAEAARLSDADPSVLAGRLVYDVMEWWVGAGSLAFPRTGRAVGERRTMPED